MQGNGTNLTSWILPLAAAGAGFAAPKSSQTALQGLALIAHEQRLRDALAQQKTEAEATREFRTAGLGLEERRTKISEEEAARRTRDEAAKREAQRFVGGLPSSQTITRTGPSLLPPALEMGLPGGPSLPPALMEAPLGATAQVPSTFEDIRRQIAASQLSPEAQAFAHEIARGAGQQFPSVVQSPPEIQRADQAIAFEQLVRERGGTPLQARAAARAVQAGLNVPIDLFREKMATLADMKNALVPLNDQGRPLEGAPPLPVSKDYTPSVGLREDASGQVLAFVVNPDPKNPSVKAIPTGIAGVPEDRLKNFSGIRAIAALQQLSAGNATSPLVPPELRGVDPAAATAILEEYKRFLQTGNPLDEEILKRLRESEARAAPVAPGRSRPPVAPKRGRLEKRPVADVFVPASP